MLNFSVAVNRRRYDRTTGRWTDLAAVFHRVVAFGALAENAANLTRGTTVTVTGELADDSWNPEDGKRVYRTQLIAADIAVSLRFAINPQPAPRAGHRAGGRLNDLTGRRRVTCAAPHLPQTRPDPKCLTSSHASPGRDAHEHRIATEFASADPGF